MLLNKFIKGVMGLHRTFIQFLAALVVLLPYVALSSGFTLGALDGLGWGSLLVVGLVHTGITYCMYFSALKDLPGQKVAILSYIDPLVAVLVSVVWLGETMTVPQIVGGPAYSSQAAFAFLVYAAAMASSRILSIFFWMASVVLFSLSFSSSYFRFRPSMESFSRPT